jgi:hypothetical protein
MNSLIFFIPPLNFYDLNVGGQCVVGTCGCSCRDGWP